jgi:ATP-dependent Lhr-like helicase
MEEGGRLRRGYFVTGLGATQFALPGAVDRLRSLRDRPEDPEVAVLSATDPANPYGATLPWPGSRVSQVPNYADEDRAAADPPRPAGRGPTRTAGATVVLVDGALTAYLARGDRQLLSFLPDEEPERSKAARAVARALIERARAPGGEGPRGMLIEEIDGATPLAHHLAPYLVEAGFIGGALGFQPDFRR